MKQNQKGFTLAELLIVVAIIAVLVAVSIPIFNKQLEKARDAATLANLRNVYSEVQTEYMDQDHPAGKNYWVNGRRHIFVTYHSGGRVIIDAFVQIESKKDVLTVNTAVRPGIYEMDFTYDSDGTLSAVALKEISYSFKENYWPVSAS